MACRKNSLRLSPRSRRSFSTESKSVEGRLRATFIVRGMVISYHVGGQSCQAREVPSLRWRTGASPRGARGGTSPTGPLFAIISPKGNPTMIASEVQQRIDQLSDQLKNIRGYL